MPTKRKTTKTAQQQIEAVAAKSTNDITADIIALQNSVRSTLSELSEGLVTKKEELDILIRVIAEKKAELEELYGKEELVQTKDALKEQVEEKRRSTARVMKELDDEYADKRNAYIRELEDLHTQEEIRIKNEERERARAQDEALYLHNQKIREDLRDIAEKMLNIDTKEKELGSFNERIEAEVSKRVRAIQAEAGYKERAMKMESDASLKILQAQVNQYAEEISRLQKRLDEAEKQATTAAERANSVVVATLEAQSNRKALEKVEAIAQKQAESGKR